MEPATERFILPLCVYNTITVYKQSASCLHAAWIRHVSHTHTLASFLIRNSLCLNCISIFRFWNCTHFALIVSDIAVFVLKRDVKLQLTHLLLPRTAYFVVRFLVLKWSERPRVRVWLLKHAGPHQTCQPCELSQISWINRPTARYLGVYFVQAKHFKCSLDTRQLPRNPSSSS